MGTDYTIKYSAKLPNQSNNKDKVDGDYKKILQLSKQKKLIKNLIKPLYLS